MGLFRAIFSGRTRQRDVERSSAPLDAAARARDYLAAKRWAAALGVIREGLAAKPEDAHLLFLRGEALFATRRFREAHGTFTKALSDSSSPPQPATTLGWSFLRAGDPEAAIQWMQKAVCAESRSVEAFHGLSVVLMQTQRYGEAFANCRRTLEEFPDDVRSIAWAGVCRMALGEPAAAEAEFRKAIAKDPSDSAGWSSLGLSLRAQRRHAEALEAFETANGLEKASDEDDTYVNLAQQHVVCGRTRDAIELCEANLSARPSVEGHRIYGHALLLAGRLAEGWPHTEFRWLREPLLSLRPGPRQRPWEGQDLHGKTVHLRVEQGYGDTIQFLRYAPMLKAAGATVLLRRFSELAYGFRGVDRVLADDEHPVVDYYVHLMSLPRLFGTDLATIPAAVPYVAVDPERDARWARELRGHGMLKVGLTWMGSPSNTINADKSLPLAALGPLLGVEGVRFFSLQKGYGSEQVKDLPPGAIVDLQDRLHDFADTAAAVNHLDVVISIDTAVAHLAGALAKPVWVLLHQDADWRWLENRDDSPWYPTMRLFRQDRSEPYGDWSSVVKRAAAALKAVRDGSEVLASRHAASAVVAPSIAPGAPPFDSTSGRSEAQMQSSAVAETRVGILQYFPDEALVGDSIRSYGEYLQQQLELLRRFVPSGATVVEVGAGVGVHALFLSAAVGPSGNVLLCEPRRAMRRVLRENLAANGAANVTLLGDAPGAQQEGDAEDAEAIDALELEQLSLLKINSTVAAEEVLDRGRETLRRTRPAVFIGVADAGSLPAVVGRVKELGYRAWKVETALHNDDNFYRRESDVFRGRRCVALLGVPEERGAAAPVPGGVEL